MIESPKSNSELFTLYLASAVTTESAEDFGTAATLAAWVSDLLTPQEQVRAVEDAIRLVRQIPAETRGRALEDLQIVLDGRKEAAARQGR